MSAIELTDITSVRQFMQKSVSDKLQDEDLEVLIRQLSEEVQRYCKREFMPKSEATRSFEMLPNGTTGYELLDVDPYELRSVVKVVVDPDLTPVTLTSVQYRLWPYPSRDGTFFGLRFAELPEPKLVTGLGSGRTYPYQTRRVDVQGEWGLGSIPQGLQHWCNVAVEAWVHLRRGMIAGNENEGEGRPVIIDDLPVPVKRGLRRWQRDTTIATA